MLPALSISTNTLSSTESLTVGSNKTIVSSREIFELGFFNLPSSSRWYLGIWYKKIPTRTYVWVANRDNPLSNSNGTLRISDNNLVIFDQSGTPVWSTNLTGGDAGSPLVAELLDNGNFVLRPSNNNDQDVFLWQSFDFLTDTLLPEMKLGWDRKTGLNRHLRSWRNPDDPSSGDFSTKLETTRGFPEFYAWNKDKIIYRSGPWSGNRFGSDVLDMKPIDYLAFNFTADNEQVTYSYRITKPDVYSRVILSSSGLLQRFTWFETEQSWRQLWYLPRDLCDDYKECGDYGYCDLNTSPVCNCIQGFETRNNQTGGCARKTRLSCGGKDGFARLKKMKLPDTTVTVVDSGVGLKECEERCLKDCNCTAFANMDIRDGGSGCVIWKGDIFDIRNFPNGGQDLYVRLAAADLVDQGRIEDSLMNELAITSRRYISRENKTDDDDLELSLMEFEGRLLDGKEIAVKRLSKMSLQGTDEFKNEVKLIARLQHINLVRLIGCCIDKGEKMLIYDGYMSPEYAMDGIFSMKSDVFSFGVLLLEIISGKKNNGFYNSNHDLNLLAFVWRKWKEGKWLEILDPIIIDSSSSTCQAHEILRCIQIGLLCVQERAEDRPVMASVMVMIGSETMAIPEPKRPGFCVGRNPLEIDSSSSTQGNDECTVNQVTLSVIDAR
ncbi:hypothetical protein YC2023_028637 [Brassica napus]